MLNNIDLKNALVLDIETVPQCSSYDQLDENWQKLWTKKMNNYVKDGVTAADVYDRAAFILNSEKLFA